MATQTELDGIFLSNSSLKTHIKHSKIEPIDYFWVQSVADLNEIVIPLAASRVLAIDTETTSLDPLEGKIRLLQLATPNFPVVIVDFFSIRSEDREPLRWLLQSSAIKISHNWKFDWRFLKLAGLEPDGILFDTFLASKLLAGNAIKNHSLKDIAHCYLKVELDKQYQLSNWSGELDREQLAYAARDAAILLRLWKCLRQMLIKTQMERVALLEFQAIPAVAEMELNGMLLDCDQLSAFTSKLESERTSIEKSLQKLLKGSDSSQTSLFPDFESINLNSNQQVLKALQTQGIPVQNTSQTALKPLAGKYPIVQMLLDYRKDSKTISTFGTALPKHVHSLTNRIHPTYWQIGAETGRFSCSQPNLQQIPRDKGMRACFVAAPGNRFVIADYSQIELRIVAEISRDPRMIEAYQEGKDLHRLTASLVTNKQLDAVTSAERQAAKAINFGLIYAMSAWGLKEYAGNTYGVEMTDQEAKTFRERFFRSYEGVAAWHAHSSKQLNKAGPWATRTLSGRLRWWLENPGLPQFLNAPVQGTSADITKQALVMLQRALQGTGALLIGTVHDEILIESPEAIAEEVAYRLQTTMEAAGGAFLQRVPVVAEVKIVNSWAEK